jgi:uncharacterized protein YecE (DUF72 family)
MRDPRGYEPWVIDLLRKYDVSLCVHDMPGSESPVVAVGPIVYVRLHGYGVKYGGTYPHEILEQWAIWLRRALASGYDAYVYFNNDINGYAVHDAERLRALVEGAQVRRGAPLSRAAEPDAIPSYPADPVPRRGSLIASSSGGDSTDEPL